MKRGEIYYIKNDRGQVGHEIMKDRPAVIVSNDEYNEKSGMVTVVFLTGKPHEDLLSHVTVYSTGCASEALCEQICTISAARVTRYMGTVTPDEMNQIETGIRRHLAIGDEDNLEIEQNGAEKSKEGQVILGSGEKSTELIRAEAERDTLRIVCNQMIECMTRSDSYGKSMYNKGNRGCQVI